MGYGGSVSFPASMDVDLIQADIDAIVSGVGGGQTLTDLLYDATNSDSVAQMLSRSLFADSGNSSGVAPALYDSSYSYSVADLLFSTSSSYSVADMMAYYLYNSSAGYGVADLLYSSTGGYGVGELLYSSSAYQSVADLLYDIRETLANLTFDGGGRLQVTTS